MLAVDIVLLRLVLALVAGAVIGIEREWRQKNAGVKTNALVALGACGFAMIDGVDHRIAANIVTGIGFIGAGVIMHRGLTIQGVTTAATLWVNASLAMAIGLGYLHVGILLLVGVLLVQFVMRRVDAAIGRARRIHLPARVEIAVQCDPSSAPLLNKVIDGTGAKMIRRTISRHDGTAVWRVVIVGMTDLAGLEEKLAGVEGVTRVDARHAGMEDTD
jgi:uncharacterized membrane protein YhiD involved in acid resistance